MGNKQKNPEKFVIEPELNNNQSRTGAKQLPGHRNGQSGEQICGADGGKLEKIDPDTEDNRIANHAGFAKGFINGSLIYCIGAMAIIGALNDGLTGDSSILYIKSALDFVC